jgi:hypothetical protein
VVLMAGLGLIQKDQEKAPIPKDSVELLVTGCLKGRVLAVSEAREPGVEVGASPNVRGRSFRLAGKKDVMEEVKRQDGHLVQVNGIVKRSVIEEQGTKIGRVEVGGGSRTAGRSGAMPMPGPADNVDVMDVLSVQQRASSCGGQ